MKATKYLDRLHNKYGWTDYRIAKELGVTTQMISALRKEKANSFGDEIAIKISDLLEIEPLTVVADMNIERAKSKEVKDFWRGIRASAAAAVLSVSLATNTIDQSHFDKQYLSENAIVQNDLTNNSYIVSIMRNHRCSRTPLMSAFSILEMSALVPQDGCNQSTQRHTQRDAKSGISDDEWPGTRSI